MKKIFIVSIVLCCLLIPIKTIHAEELLLAEKAKSAVIIEPTTGTILFEKNSHEKLHPASMTKMMSMLLIMEAIEDKTISWDEMITVSETASSMGGSQILLEVGEKMSVRDLFKGVAVASGNDAVVALAERIAGTKDEFVKKMNARAKELGLKDTNFKNPHGLDDANHYSSAYDMALIAKELSKHEEVFKFTSIYEDYLRKGTDKEIWLVNTNKLVRFYDGVDGFKTGYTKEAGYCLTASAKRNGMRIITVVMGEEDSKVRNAETTQMLDYAFAQYNLNTLLSKDSIVGKKEINKGKQKLATIVPKEDVTALIKKSDKKKEINYTLSLDQLKAPIKRGDTVGSITVKEDGKTTRTIPVTVKQDIKKANIMELYMRYLKDILAGDITL
ncbi:MAG: D-alanyl-D-alanine carboxypeptidase [Bacilli bacterium]|nr:D-alanyl-D-alanine carboxypeptidase [Bacilli bacterium]